MLLIGIVPDYRNPLITEGKIVFNLFIKEICEIYFTERIKDIWMYLQLRKVKHIL